MTSFDRFTGDCHYRTAYPSSYCSVNDAEGTSFSSNGEYFGAHSRCFEGRSGNNPIARCLKSKVSLDRLTIKCENGQVVFQVGTTEYICSYEGQEIRDSGITITCPSVQNFCYFFDQRCPLDCSGHGICLNDGKCFCLEGYSGLDCVSLTSWLIIFEEHLR